MPTVALTDRKISNLKPKPGKRIVIFDSAIKAEALGGGLCLRAGKSSKVFYSIFYEGGKPRYFKLGRHPQLSLKEARAKTRLFLENPQAHIDERKTGSFREVVENFIALHVQKKGLRSEAEITRLLERNVMPQWARKPFHEIRRSDVTRLLDKIERERGQKQADNSLAVIRKIMNWHESRNDNYRSPIIRGMMRGSVAESARTRILDDDELRNVWNAGEGVFGAIVKIALLTSQRRSKIQHMQWDDIDDDGIWKIPTEAREKGNAGELKLPSMALDIINEQPRIKDNPYVFTAAKGQGPFNSFSKAKNKLERKLPEDMESWVLHDLRRTARSLMSRAGINQHTAERVLGHAIAGVEGTYDRHLYTEEKAEALEKLSKLITLILNPPADSKNIITLKR